MKYVVLMAVVPAVVMFVSYNFVLDYFFTFTHKDQRMVYAGVAAIVSVQLVIIKYLHFAFNEDPEAGTPPAGGASTKPKST